MDAPHSIIRDSVDRSGIFGGGEGGALAGDASVGTAMNDSFLLPSFGGSAVAMHPPASHYSSESPRHAYVPALQRGSSASASPSSSTASYSYGASSRDKHELPTHQNHSTAGDGAFKSHLPLHTTPTTSGDSSGSSSVGRRNSATPAWVKSVQAATGARPLGSRTSPRDAMLLALDSISSARVSSTALSPQDDVRAIVSLLSAPSVLSMPGDILAVISALHVIASDEERRDTIIVGDGLETLASLTRNSATEVHSLAPMRSAAGSSAAAFPLQTSLPRPVWDAAVRTMSKLVIFSNAACKRAVEGDGLAILAASALPSEAMNSRVRAAAGVAAISLWSGPRYAVEVLETRNVIAAMAGVLAEEDKRVPPNVRLATVDGLNVLAHRRRAQVILTEGGCKEFITLAARNASVSGDHDIAARSTVVAGQIAGHSVDEFGFLVETGEDDLTNRDSGLGNSMRPSENNKAVLKSDGDALVRRQETGLVAIRNDLLHDQGYKELEDNGAVPGVFSSAPHAVLTSASQDPLVLGQAGRAQSSADALFMARGVDPDEDDTELSPLAGFTAATERAVARGAGMPKKSPSQLARDAKNDQIWENVLKNRPQDLDRENDGFGRVRAYRDLAGVPIPSKLRAIVWPKLLDVEGLRARKPGLYDALCKHGETASLPEDIEHTIEADLTRTMPLHCLFWRNGAAPGIVALGRVLRAYAFHVPSVGYCQGMSSIAALILLNSQTEEDAFLMLVRFLSRYGFKNVYKPGFPQYKQWVDELREVIAARMPGLNALFDREGVMPELFLDKSIITCLTHNYPHRALVRIWDLMFLGGSPKIILKACLAVLVLSEKRMMSMDFEQMVNFLQRGFADPGVGIVDDENVEQFLECARSVKLTTEPVPVPKSGIAPSPSLPSPQSPGPANPPQKSRGGCFPCFGGKRKHD